MDVDEMRRKGGENSRKNMTKTRAAEIARAAGIASGKARRANKTKPKISSVRSKDMKYGDLIDL